MFSVFTHRPRFALHVHPDGQSAAVAHPSFASSGTVKSGEHAVSAMKRAIKQGNVRCVTCPARLHMADPFPRQEEDRMCWLSGRGYHGGGSGDKAPVIGLRLLDLLVDQVVELLLVLAGELVDAFWAVLFGGRRLSLPWRSRWRRS